MHIATHMEVDEDGKPTTIRTYGTRGRDTSYRPRDRRWLNETSGVPLKVWRLPHTSYLIPHTSYLIADSCNFAGSPDYRTPVHLFSGVPGIHGMPATAVGARRALAGGQACWPDHVSCLRGPLRILHRSSSQALTYETVPLQVLPRASSRGCPALAASPAPMLGHEPNASRNAARLIGAGIGRPGLVSGSQTPAPHGSSHIACQPNSEHPQMKSAMARTNTALSPPPR